MLKALVSLSVWVCLLASFSANAVNAKFFRLDEAGGLQRVTQATWQNRWSQIVPFAVDGRNLLLFYNREQGSGKVYSYDSRGKLRGVASRRGWSKGWDNIVSGSFGRANMVFYNRVTGLLRAYRFASNGAMSKEFEQTIENPLADNRVAPGWDIVVPGRWRGDGELLFYNRSEGRFLFLGYDSRRNKFVPKKRYHGLNRSWDEIQTGDFNADGVDDLVLYDLDSGELKVVYLDDNYRMQGSGQLAADGGIKRSHYAQLLVGDFGGGNRSDVLLYQQDNGLGEGKGRGILWTDRPKGDYGVRRIHSNWSDTWTHVLPVNLGGRRTGLLFYRNQVLLNLNLYRARPLSDQASDTGTWSNVDQLDEWVSVLKKTYKAAGIYFNVTVIPDTVYNDFLGQFSCSKTGWQTLVKAKYSSRGEWFPSAADLAAAVSDGDPDRYKAIVEAMEAEAVVLKENYRDRINDWVTFVVPKDTIPVVVRPGGGGCSSMKANFAIAGSGSLNNKKHLSHEIGHYLGLAHTHIGYDTKAKLKTRLDKLEGAGEDGLNRQVRLVDVDSDLIAPGNFSKVYDTPPVLHRKYIDNAYGQLRRCQPGSTDVLRTTGGTDVLLWQDSHNVMAYVNCNDLFRISKDQARVIRQELFGSEGKRRDLADGQVYVHIGSN